MARPPRPPRAHGPLLASALALALAQQASAHQPAEAPKGQERCYGVAKKGQNDCGNLGGTHDCAGQAPRDFAIDEWKYVPAGTCKKLKGYSEAEARRKLGKG